VAADPLFIPKALLGRFPQRKGLSALIPTTIALVGMVSLLLLVQISGVAATAYKVQRLEALRTYWQEANYQAEKEIARLQSLDRIEQEAKGRLKMVAAKNPLYITVERAMGMPDRKLPLRQQEKAGTHPSSMPWWQQMMGWVSQLWRGI
jgi:hypothetical protein